MAQFQADWANVQRTAEEQARMLWEAQQNYNAHSRAADAFAYAAAAQQPKRRASRFAGPDVIDLVQGAGGAWRVPEHLEYRMRQP